MELSPDLLTIMDVLPPPNRRMADLIRSRGDAALALYLDGQRRALAAYEARRIAAEAVDRLPGLTAFQSAFVGTLGPDLKAALESMPAESRASILMAVELDMVPDIVDHLHGRLRSAASGFPGKLAGSDNGTYVPGV